MEPATIAVLLITAAFLGFCIWIERHSRSQERAHQSSQSAGDPPDAAEDRAPNGNGK
jgi:hypothetical protein